MTHNTDAKNTAEALTRGLSLAHKQVKLLELAQVKTYGEMALYLAENVSMLDLINLKSENMEMEITYREAERIQTEELTDFRIY